MKRALFSSGRPTNVADREGGLPPAKQPGIQVARGALALLSTQPITWSASLASAVLVPRFLGDDGLGRYAIAWTVGSFIGVVASLGLPGLLVRLVATDPSRAATYAWSSLAIVASCWLAITGVALSIIALLDSTSIDLGLVAIAVVAALGFAALSVLTAVLNGLGRHARYAWSIAGSSVLGTAAGLCALALGAGASGYAMGLLLASTASAAVLWWTSGLAFQPLALSRRIVSQLVRGGLPFLGWNAAIRVRAQIDVVLVGILLEPSVAGWLAAAYWVINVAVFVPTIITVPLLPTLSRAKEQADVFRSVLAESLAMVLLLTVPISVTMFALAPSLPGMLGWPTSLQPAVPLIMLLAFQETLVGVDMVLGTALIALGLERRWLGVAVIGAVFNPVLNLFAIPATSLAYGNGGIGAAVVELATEGLFLVGAVVLMPRSLLIRNTVVDTLRVIAAGSVMLAVMLLLRAYSPVLAIASGGLAYLAAAFASGALRYRHVRAVRLALRLA